MDFFKKQFVPAIYIITAFLYVLTVGYATQFGAIVATIFSNMVLIVGFSLLYIYDRKQVDYDEVIDNSLIKTYYKNDIFIIYTLIILLWYVGQFVFLWVYDTYGDTTYTIQYAENFSKTPAIFVVLLVGTLAPVAEELVFRYALFGRYIFSKGLRVPVFKYLFLHILSTSLFALIHGTTVHLIVVLPLSFLLAMLYYKTNRISYPIIGHMLFNNMSIWLGWTISSYRSLLNNPFVVFSFISIYVVLVLGVLYFVWSRRKN